ncbi:SH2 domain-containing protein 4A isoform X2 [Mastacembelus armatus]|uniref:SH2 domain-containing protein 4A isoform X2 n=1 Tax=Mastacembelus armatus TaxID=205130 RepID=UPI000E4638C9|nr:SH2 domain-containing protein 4A-like isoform X2 [Mastacembelus armatus]
MLAKILEDMWVEPEVLEALSEEQKRILFLKMREEQVRRWREREEREEREGNNNITPKKDSRKHVSWLLGRDGDVSVSIIGEVDEFRSSKLLQSLMNNRIHRDNMNGIQKLDLLPGSEGQQLCFKEDIQLPHTEDCHGSPNDQSSEEDMDSCSVDDDARDTTEDSDSESGTSSDNLSDWTPRSKAHLRSHVNQPPLKAQLEVGSRNRENVCCNEKRSEHENRVAQLRKAFGDHHSTTGAYSKPPIPAKPAHLQKRSTALIH